MEYTTVIRTLGKGSDIYRKMLDSLLAQSIPPSSIIVYIAEGYPLPKETVGVERYVYVKKGMVAQRALTYDEVSTEYCLFLDDDVYLPSHAVETLYNELVGQDAQVISPCVFANHKVTIKDKIRLSILGREVCRPWSWKWGYKVLRTAGFSYNNHPAKPVYESQSNAGPCFFCRKEDFLKIHYEEELWLDKTFYAFPEDQVMYYKMYKTGLKILTSFDSGIIHLDASSTITNTKEKTERLIYSEYRNKLIFWHRFIFLPEKNLLLKFWSVIAIFYVYGIQGMKYGMKYIFGDKGMPIAYKKGLMDGFSFIKSEEYKRLPKVKSCR